MRSTPERGSPTTRRSSCTWGRGAGSCGGAACPFRARLLDAHTLRIERGQWPERAGEGVERRCRQMAESSPDTLEVASRSTDELDGSDASGPGREDVRIEPQPMGVVIERRSFMASAADAAEREAFDSFSGPPLGRPGLLPESVDHERHGALLIDRLHVRWEDLSLLLEDERRLAQARMDGEGALTPVDRVDVRDLANLQRQVRLRREAMEAQRGAARRTSARDLRRLLERGMGAHPDEPTLSRALVRLLLDAFSDAEAAVALTERVLASHPPDLPGWRLLHREAKALIGADALAPVLVSDHRVAPRDAHRAAEDLAQLRSRGVDYEHAEAMWLAADALARRGARIRTSPVHPTGVAFDVAVESVVWLLDARGHVPTGPREVYVLAHGQRGPGATPPWNPLAPSLLDVHDPQHHPALVGVAMADDEARLRGLGILLGQAFYDGPIDLAIGVLPSGGDVASAATVVHLEGRVGVNGLAVERVSAPLDQLSWPKVARYLTEPLARLELRPFPRPSWWSKRPTTRPPRASKPWPITARSVATCTGTASIALPRPTISMTCSGCCTRSSSHSSSALTVPITPPIGEGVPVALPRRGRSPRG